MLVHAIMTSPVVTIRPETSAADAARTMLDNHISGLPVVDALDRLVGIVTEGDFLRRTELHTERKRSWLLELLTSRGTLADEYVMTHGRTVEEIMTSDVVTVTTTTTLLEVVELMEKHHIKRIPVVSHGKLVGIVSRSDLLAALVQILPARQRDTRDQEIETAIINELATQDWSRGGSIRVKVIDGVAELSGNIMDERERRAAKVAAENIPGVRAVFDNLIYVDPYIGVGIV
ncbi:CBS domain-containing protein [Rhizobium sp. P28RR-XV]|uniref:CBS domain-containing protein n=1 Tax=Rhizobium sp. P28RR-XV TaxID=2726737 RepID=UPI0014562F92|nr:CBS domain-containing protein [Rhizobium sp. P28RR-XV]NLR89411.1 CBS domain-containing protein [Rhizobium sp. P28RR-XV]